MKSILAFILVVSAQMAAAKPGTLNVSDFNDIIQENAQVEPELRKSIQDLSGLEKQTTKTQPSFKPTKENKQDLTESVAVTLPKKKVKTISFDSPSFEESSMPRISEEVEESK